jgi:hypothetical protein
LDVTKQIRAVLTRDHSVEGLADATVVWMSPLAEAQARPAPQCPLGAVYHRLDLWPVDHLGQRVGGRPNALEGVCDGLPDSPADLGQGVGQLGVLPAIAHNPYCRTQTGPQLGRSKGVRQSTQ